MAQVRKLKGKFLKLNNALMKINNYLAVQLLTSISCLFPELRIFLLSLQMEFVRKIKTL